ncbi:hypothetical protein [Bacillus sp. B-jedd]|uniref:hypothetical protein n=1 Tax=Bacillus sp. B-jedd TaxID=1476857 RepID=UPI000515725D|nr:hypothetical protein [Bacillus sp. B-jedd]CEG29010.1 hypothetical protein BN1002_03938 [Bacillus sp. B-jedd]
MDFITLGKVSLSVDVAATVAAAVLAPLLHKAVSGKKTGDWFWNALFYFFLTAKISYFLFNWGTFIKSPFSLIYFDGGSKGMVLALGAVLVYLYRQTTTGAFHPRTEGLALFHQFFLTWLTAGTLMAKAWPASIVYFLLLAGTLVMVNRQKKLDIQVFILLAMAEVLGLSLFGGLFGQGSLAILSVGLFIVMMAYLKKEGVSRE